MLEDNTKFQIRKTPKGHFKVYRSLNGRAKPLSHVEYYTPEQAFYEIERYLVEQAELVEEQVVKVEGQEWFYIGDNHG